MLTPKQLLEEFDNRFRILAVNKARNIDVLNMVSNIKLPIITIDKVEYQETFKNDELLLVTLFRIAQLGNCIGMFVKDINDVPQKQTEILKNINKQRQYLNTNIMKQKNWTTDHLDFLRNLDAKLRQEETRILALYESLEPTLKDMVAKGIIDCYNDYDWIISVSSSDEACNKRYGLDEEGDYFYEYHGWLPITCCNRDSSLGGENKLNWNERMHWKDHPLEKEDFCYTMHCVLFHFEISSEDILAIDNVIMRFTVDYEWFTNEETKAYLKERVLEKELKSKR